MRTALVVPVVVLALAPVLVGCGAAPDNAADGVIRVVASTNVYGDLAETIGGPDVEVTSIIDDPTQDPHEYQANGRVQLALSRADIVIVNGGGYDDFATTMLEASGNDGARVVDAVELSGHEPGADGFNEHVWFDYPTMQRVMTELGAALGAADPDNAADYEARAQQLAADTDTLIGLQHEIADTSAGTGVVITEPLPLYLLEAAGLTNLTPPEFSEAIEQDTDVSPLLLQSVLNLIGDGSAALVVYNIQTVGPQTDAVLDIASENGVPALGVSEVLPADQNYLDWQRGLLNALQKALQP